jgi:hypothetical protein
MHDPLSEAEVEFAKEDDTPAKPMMGEKEQSEEEQNDARQNTVDDLKIIY